MEGDLVWKRKFSPTTYSFKPILSLVDELTIASYTRGEVRATEVRTLSPGSVWLLHSYARSWLTYSTEYTNLKGFQSLACGLINNGGGKKWKEQKMLTAERSAESHYNLVCSKDLEKQTNKNMGMFVLPMELLRNIQV